MAALLDVSDVTLRYKTSSAVVTATERVSFTVDRSDRFVLLGPSGCGKSTLLKAVGGYMMPSEGKMRISGREISEPGADRMMIFQEFDQLLPWKTVLENVMFPLLMTRRLPRKEAEVRARAYIEKVSLTRVVDAYPHTLSGGMKQRVAIARGMAMEPDILLMDEPFAALDALTRRTCQDELLQLWSETKFTVLFVTIRSPKPSRSATASCCCRRIPDGSRLKSSTSIRFPAKTAAPRGSKSKSTISCFRTRTTKPRRCSKGHVMGEAKILMRDTSAAAASVEVERKLSVLERLWNDGFVRKAVIILFLAVVWEAYGTYLDNPLLFPTFHDTIVTMFEKVRDGTIPLRAWASLKVLFMGYSAGIILAAIFTILAISTRIGTDFLETVTAMFNPLPAIALLPLALIWFGLGTPSLVFVIIHSVLWAVALNTLVGFRSVPETLRMSGRNFGLRGIRYVALLLIPAAFAAILAGMKIGWAFAWRTLIAAELVFGVSSRSGGLGWYIFEARSELETAKVFAGLFAVILIGLFVESVIFKFIERRTVLRWGMQR